MSHALILVLALLLDALLGEPRWLWTRVPHPAVLMGRPIAWADRVLNNDTKWMGCILISALCCIGWGIGLSLSLLGPWIEVIGIAILLAQRSLTQHIEVVARELRMSLPSARRATQMIVSRDTAHMDGPQLTRSALESGAENLSDGVIAPAFWALLFGLPGIVVYKIINTADSMIGYKTTKHVNFGWATARLDDVVNWGPARLTAGLLWITGGARANWRHIIEDAHKHKSPNAGWPEAVLARTLNVALAGPRMYHGVMQDLPWVHEPGEKKVGPAQIEQGIHQIWSAWKVFVSINLILVLCM
ncbi:MAG: adenosylcobinamide-phosphate synthase CbiB [Paracoccaceae bacterium]